MIKKLGIFLTFMRKRGDMKGLLQKILNNLPQLFTKSPSSRVQVFKHHPLFPPTKPHYKDELQVLWTGFSTPLYKAFKTAETYWIDIRPLKYFSHSSQKRRASIFANPWRLPNFSLPAISFPSFTLPKISFPTITLPNLSKTSSPNATPPNNVFSQTTSTPKEKIQTQSSNKQWNMGNYLKLPKVHFPDLAPPPINCHFNLNFIPNFFNKVFSVILSPFSFTYTYIKKSVFFLLLSGRKLGKLPTFVLKSLFLNIALNIKGIIISTLSHLLLIALAAVFVIIHICQKIEEIASTEIATPSINLPQLPKISLPKLTLPRLTIPKLTFPKGILDYLSPFKVSLPVQPTQTLEISHKQYLYTVSEAAKFLGVSADTLRNWEEKGKLIPQRTAGGARRYRLEQLKSVLSEKNPALAQAISSSFTTPAPTPVEDTPSWYSNLWHNPFKSWFKLMAPRLVYAPVIAIILFAVVSKLVAIPSLLNFSTNASLTNSQQTETLASLNTPLQPSTTTSGEVLAEETVAKYLEINANTTLKGNLTAEGTINGLSLSSSDTGITLSDTTNQRTLTITGNDITLDQSLSTTSSPDLSSLNLNATKDQLIFSQGAGTLTWTPTGANKTITLPNATDTLVGRTTTDTLKNKTINSSDGNIISGTFPDITGITSLGTVSTGTWNGTTIDTGYGGTGLTSYTQGDLLYSSASNTLGKLPVGTSGQFLTVSDGVPSWTDLTTVGLEAVKEGGTTTGDGITSLDFLGGDFDLSESPTGEINIQLASTLASVTGVAGNFDIATSLNVGTDNAFRISSAGAITAATGITSSGTITFSGLSLANGIVHTDANGVLSASTLDLNSEVTGTLSVTKGGTGATTLAQYGVLYGNGTSAVGATAAGSTGMILVATSGAAPSFAAMNGDVTIDNSGTTTIGSNAVVLNTNTEGTYIESLAVSSPLSLATVNTENINATISLQADSISDTYLTYNTGQHLTTSSSPIFANLYTTGNIGIGTTVPTQNLEVNGNIKTTGAIIGTLNGLLKATSGTIGTATAGVDYQAYNANTTILGNTTTGTGSTLVLSQSPNFTGNVGIGTTAPEASLDIASKFQVDSSGNLIKINNIGYSWPSGLPAENDYALTTSTTGTLTWKNISEIGGIGDITGITTSNGLTGGGDSGALTLSIDLPSSTVGIGSTSSYSGLEFASNKLTLLQGCADGQVLAWNEDNSIWACADDSTGAEGTGDITSVIAGAGLSGGGTIDDVTLSLNLGNANTWTAAQTFSTNTFFPANGIWDSTGNVGIGTSVPTQNLEVNGTVKIGTLNGLLKGTNGVLGTATAGVDYQAYDSDLAIFAGITPSANVQTLLAAGDFAAFKTSLSLENVENTALSTWVGSTNITTLGTISTGTWNSTDIGVEYGGTGASTFTTNAVLYGQGTSAIAATSAGTSGQLLVAGSEGVPAFVTMSGDATLSNTGALTIGADKVTLATDTEGNYVGGISAGNSITVSNSGTENATVTVGVTNDSITDTQLTYDTGQHLTTTSSPTFAGLTLNSSNETGTTSNSSFVFNANSLSSGTGLYLSSTSTALSTGSLAILDWSPGSPTTSTGDLLSLNIGANGTIGNIFNVKDNGSSVFSVSQTAITASLPTAFNAPGDVAVAYDLNFTNPTASYIKSNAPMYIQAGKVFNSSDLTLKTFNAGSTVITQDNNPTAAGTSYALQILPTLTSSTNSLTYTAQYGTYSLPTVNLTGTSGTVTSLYNNYQGLSALAGTVSNWYGYYVAAPTGSGTITNKYAFVSEPGAGNVGIGTTAPIAGFHNANSTLYGTLAVSNLASGGSIGTAANTVDIYTNFNLSQTTASQTVTLPNPSNTTAGRIAYISNTGSTAFSFYGSSIATGGSAAAIWDGDSWNLAGGGGIWSQTGSNIYYNSGNVGIGTTVPGAKLDISSTSATGPDFRIVNTGAVTGTVAQYTADSLTTGKLFDLSADALTTGTVFNLQSTSASLSSGTLMNLNWAPTGSSNVYATGDLLSISTGNAYAFPGNFFNIKDNGTSIFSVSQTQVTTNLPTNFTAAGDVAISYDINMTNPTASYIKSAAPIYIQSGETFNSSDLNLKTFNVGSTIITQDNNPTAAGTAYALQLLPTLTSSTNSMTYTALYGNYNVANVNLSGNAATDLTTLYSNYTGLTATAGTIGTWYGDYIAAPTGSGTVTAKYAFVTESAAGNVGIGTTAPVSLLDVSQKLNVLASGNIGIGTTSPQATLDVNGNIYIQGGSVSAPSLTFGTDTNTGIYRENADILGLAANGQIGLTVNGNSGVGRVLIGELVSPVSKLHINDDDDVTAAGGITLGGNTETDMQIFRSGSNLLSIMGGNVGVGTTTPAYVFQVQTATNEGHVNADGTWGSSSDIALKTNISQLSGSLDKVMELNSLRFDFIGETPSASGEGQHIGFIAQEMEKVLPEIVSTSPVTGLKAIAYSQLTPLLVGAIQEQQDGIQSLELRVKDLEEKTASHSAQIAELIYGPEKPIEPALNLTPVDGLISTESAVLAEDIATYSEATISGKLLAYEATIQSVFKSLGETILANTTIAGELTVDGTTTITGNSISTMDTLYLQNGPLASSIDIFNGAILMDKSGSITVNKLVVSDIKGVSTTQDPTIGSDTIEAGDTSITISNNQITSSTKVFLTPRGSTGKQSLYVGAINPSQNFTIKIDEPLTYDLKFDWWIIETK